MRKSAFTLVEVLISVLLASLIFYYSYGVIDTTKNNHKIYTQKTQKLLNSSLGLSLLYRDLQNSLSGVSVVHGRDYDRVSFYSKNSIYGMKNPYVQYFVSNKDKTLLRVENKESFDVFSIGSSVDQKLPVMFLEKIVQSCDSFRVLVEDEQISVMLRTNEADILFKVFRGKSR